VYFGPLKKNIDHHVSTARRISLGGAGNALYAVLSGYYFDMYFTIPLGLFAVIRATFYP